MVRRLELGQKVEESEYFTKNPTPAYRPCAPETLTCNMYLYRISSVRERGAIFPYQFRQGVQEKIIFAAVSFLVFGLGAGFFSSKSRAENCVLVDYTGAERVVTAYLFFRWILWCGTYTEMIPDALEINAQGSHAED